MEPVVSAEHVRARWAYSELLSDRPYNDPSVQELKKKALEGVPFEDLNADEHGLLAQTWYRVRGVPTFIHGFAGITTFQLADWSREQLATSYVIPYFAHEVGAQELVTFKQWIEAEPIRLLEPGHARYATSGAPRSTQVDSQDGGGIVLYLEQEGRGLGLANKIRTYQLQDGGLNGGRDPPNRAYGDWSVGAAERCPHWHRHCAV